MKGSFDEQKLIADVCWGISHGFSARDLVPMLKRLVAQAPIETDAGTFGRQRLAELIVGEQPWRAARLTRDLIIAERADAQTYAVLGLALSLLGHFRCAVQSYERALLLAPRTAVYSHNLGHLLDVALGRPREALPHLAAAYRSDPGDVEVAASYAHALQHAGRAGDARHLLERVFDRATASQLLERWNRPDRQASVRELSRQSPPTRAWPAFGS